MKLQDYKKLLTKKLQDMQSNQVATEDIAVEQHADLMDGIQRTTDRELALATRAMSWKITVAVRAALERVAAGAYGVCLGCEEPITERRLTVIPWAEQCIVCQRREELEPVALAA